jgi:hypothetical protein
MALFDFFNPFNKKGDKSPDIPEKREESFAPPNLEDAVVINSGGIISHSIQFADQGNLNERDLISSWRELASRPEIDWAIQEIVNEAIVTDYTEFPVNLVVPDDLDIPKKIADKLREEFQTILKLLNFNRSASEKFRQWYIDGKHYYHGIVDSKNPSNGLIGVRWIDPRTIKKIVEVEKTKNSQGITVEKIKDIYYLYDTFQSGNSFSGGAIVQTKNAIKVHPDAIAYSNSGIFKEKPDGTTIAISHLDKAVKPANQLRLLEDYLVIYRLARAPERRIFYVDTGNLPKTKAEQYIQGIMNRFKNKMVYDINTGEVKDQRNFLSILEDYWLPRREGGRGTEVTTLPGGQSLGELDDVEYFYKKLFKSLNIPTSRLQSDSNFNLGRSAEITREEVKFTKFIEFLRSRFSETFIQLLKIQVITKNIMSDVDFDEISSQLTFKWKTDSYWDELMSNEMWQTRANLMQQLDPYVGKYFSKEWIRKNVLSMTEEEIEDIDKQIASEPKDDLEDNQENDFN